MLSILAGLMIGLGGSVYLILPDKFLGSLMFSLGLLTILYFRFALFTGKAGLLSQWKIGPVELTKIFVGNAIGTGVMALLVRSLPKYELLFSEAQSIVQAKSAQFWLNSLFLGVLCGLLMFIAVEVHEKTPLLTIMCVSSFITIGANHCVADMFYYWVGTTADNWVGVIICLFWTTIGNVIGCNLINLSKKINL